jgi:phytoene dehydrogenase-like protein
VDYTFQSPEMRYFFASCGLHGALAPDDALGASFAWLFAAAVQDVGGSIVKGGMHNVSRALVAELKAHGGEIRVNAGVKSIVVKKGRATCVTLENEEGIALDGVLASNVDPRHLVLDLLGEAQVGEGVAGNPTARPCPISISVAPAVILAPASPWLLGAMPRRSFAAISGSPSQASSAKKPHERGGRTV